MQKLVVLCLSLFALTAVAEEQKVKAIFCPAEVVCTRMYDISSCSYDAQQAEYWGALLDSSGLVPDVYTFKEVFAPYHAEDNWTTDCFYNHKSDEGNRTIILRSKPQANIEIYHEANSLWNIYMEDFGHCKDDAKACRLKEQAAVLFQNMSDTTVWLSGAAYGGGDILTLPTGKPQDHYFKLRYEQLGHCNDTDLCTFDVINKSGIIGTVTVDIENRLKIVSINTVDGTLYSLEKFGDMNTIDIHGVGLPHQQVIDVYNAIRSDIIASVKGISLFEKPLPPAEPDVMTIPSVGKIFYGDMTQHCHEDLCVVEFKTLQGTKIGSMTVDMNDDMAIVDLVSHRPSEIFIEKLNETSVRIKYAFIQS